MKHAGSCPSSGVFAETRGNADPGEPELCVQTCKQPHFNLQESLLFERERAIYCKRADIIRKTYPKTRYTVESAVFFADKFDLRRRIEARRGPALLFENSF